MSHRSSRRTFLKSTAAAPLVAAAWPTLTATAAPVAPPAQVPPPPPGSVKKSVLYSMLPKDLPVADKFKIAIDAGFVGVEMHTEPNQALAEQAKAAAEKTGLKIHSVMNADHWKYPLSSADPDVVLKSLAGMETSLRNAAFWGAGNVLLVPAVVDATTQYGDAWARSQKVIKSRILPLAAELKIVVAIEEVWNKFLLSPLEMAKYVDELDSPWA